MSVAVPSRLANSSSVLDDLMSRNPVLGASSAADEANPEVDALKLPHIEEDPASKNVALEVLARLTPLQLESGENIEKNTQPGYNAKAVQQPENVRVGSSSREERMKEVNQKLPESHLESFASALDYVLQHLLEEEQGTGADGYAMPC